MHQWFIWVLGVFVKEPVVKVNGMSHICEVSIFVNAFEEVEIRIDYQAINDHAEAFILVTFKSIAEILGSLDDDEQKSSFSFSARSS